MKPLVIGIGNPFRGDDAIGFLAVEQLKKRSKKLADFTLVSDLSDLLDIWSDHERSVIIDAVFNEEAKPGTIYQLDDINELIGERGKLHSSHGFGLSEALEMAKEMERFPLNCQFVGIHGKSWSYGSGLTPEVAEALPTVVDLIHNKLQIEMVESER